VGTSLAYAGVAALANVLGAAVVTSHTRWGVRALEVMVALAAGFMISVVLLDIFPEALGRGGSGAAVAALAGVLLVHLSQHALVRHFHFGEETHRVSQTVGLSALAGLLLHTLVDGVAIASSFQVSKALGLLVFTAIVLHKVPEGLAISSLFLAAGASRGRAMLAAAALGAATIVGVILTDRIGFLSNYGLGLSAGVTLYVALSNLVPEFQHRRVWRLQLAFFAGCAAYIGVRSLVGPAS